MSCALFKPQMTQMAQMRLFFAGLEQEKLP